MKDCSALARPRLYTTGRPSGFSLIVFIEFMQGFTTQVTSCGTHGAVSLSRYALNGFPEKAY
jgi:hypothetical protein